MVRRRITRSAAELQLLCGQNRNSFAYLAGWIMCECKCMWSGLGLSCPDKSMSIGKCIKPAKSEIENRWFRFISARKLCTYKIVIHLSTRGCLFCRCGFEWTVLFSFLQPCVTFFFSEVNLRIFPVFEYNRQDQLNRIDSLNKVWLKQMSLFVWVSFVQVWWTSLSWVVWLKAVHCYGVWSLLSSFSINNSRKSSCCIT